jgi:prevent-host-death family protein
VDVAISAFRAELAGWIHRAQQGEDVVITERGVPVARLSAVGSTSLVDRLTREGVLARPERPGRPRARGAARVRASGPVADLVGEQRGG